MPERYLNLLKAKLNETRADSEGNRKSLYSRDEVQSILLDLWNELTADHPELIVVETVEEIEVEEPVTA